MSTYLDNTKIKTIKITKTTEQIWKDMGDWFNTLKTRKNVDS